MNEGCSAVLGHKPIVQAADSIGRSLLVTVGCGPGESASEDSGDHAWERDGRIHSYGHFPRAGFANHGQRKNAPEAPLARLRKESVRQAAFFHRGCHEKLLAWSDLH